MKMKCKKCNTELKPYFNDKETTKEKANNLYCEKCFNQIDIK